MSKDHDMARKGCPKCGGAGWIVHPLLGCVECKRVEAILQSVRQEKRNAALKRVAALEVCVQKRDAMLRGEGKEKCFHQFDSVGGECVKCGMKWEEPKPWGVKEVPDAE